MASFYYPRGPFGPICDTILPDDDGDRVVRLGDDDDEGKLIPIDGGPRPDPEGVEPWPQPIVKCKTRTLDDGTIEYYDCVTEYDKDTDDGSYNGDDCIKDINGECFDWKRKGTDEWGLDDDFFVPEIGPISCLPFDSDINIRPVPFISRNNSNEIVIQDKYACEKSSPVTFGVTAAVGQVSTSFGGARFSDDGRSIITSGTSGTGRLDLRLEWDDNPNTNGTALGSIEVGGVTFTQTSGVEEGSQSASIDISAGTTYPLTFTNLHPANKTIKVENKGKRLCLLDDDGDDCNATFEILGASGGGVKEISLWNETADRYAVWTNPEVCTLPCIPQEVTYRIFFDKTDTYYFEFGADDFGALYFDSETVPFAEATTPSMLNDDWPEAGDPTIVERQITAGIHLLTARVTNSPAGTRNETPTYVSSNNTLTSNGQTFGTISLGPATAIRNELDGFSDTSGSNLNEVGGFSVPSDSPTKQYLSFGTIEATTTTDLVRTASITMDLRQVASLKFTIIAGDDNNGGERPNDVADVLEINMGQGWVVLAPSKQYAGISFAEYDQTYGNWYDFDINVPESARTSNFTIQLRSAGDTPEIGGTYNGLAGNAFAAAYANCADVFGLYKVTMVSSLQSANCGEGSYGYDSYDWSKNPGGWYVKICKGSPCYESQSLNWVKSGPVGAWGDLMNNYAVWPTANDADPGVVKTLTYTVHVERDATLVLEYSGDNAIDIIWDNTQLVSGYGSFNTNGSLTFAATKGTHKLTMNVVNTPNGNGDDSWSNNPAGGAWTLAYQETLTATFDSNGNIVVGGTGSGTIGLALEWDDNPNTYGTALGTYSVGGVSLTQTSGVEKGAAAVDLNVTGGSTYSASISGNPGGFKRQRDNTELCFKDGHGDDCNAKIKITGVTGRNGIIKTSADMSQDPDTNLYWHTRMATGYTYVLNQNCSGVYTP
jgi:hypothetical protein